MRFEMENDNNSAMNMQMTSRGDFLRTDFPLKTIGVTGFIPHKMAGEITRDNFSRILAMLYSCHSSLLVKDTQVITGQRYTGHYWSK